jgi:8-oxo-dGTP diphosphatase
MTSEKKVGVGIAVLVLKKDEKAVLLGKRRGISQGGICVNGGGEWNLPGGKLNYLERIKEGSLRELGEETGLNGINIELIDKFPCVATENFLESGTHFITLYLRAKYVKGIPRVMEPKECLGWEWYQWTRLPESLFLPVRSLVNQGYDPFRGLK